MIEVKDLVKNYGNRAAVNHISFEVKKGEILGFLGQNGAGKSTTMKILTCFMPATSGTAKIGGYDVFENALEVKKKIGYLPETPPIYPELLVSEYLRFVAELRGIPSRDRKKKIEKVIELCFLGDVRNRLIGNLSKGYKQRVGLAQALIHDPEVLILDEPTVGLDPKQVTEARNLIRGMRNERTVIYSTHILSEVAATCDRIIIIDKGKIVAQEALNAMGNTGLTTRTELIIQKLDEGVVSSIRGINGVKNVETYSNGTHRLVVETEPREDIMAEMAKAVVAKNAGLVRMSPVAMALEEYYLDLIGGKRSTQ